MTDQNDKDQNDKDQISQMVGRSIDDTAKEFYFTVSQEASITSRIGSSIERSLNGKTVGKYSVNITTLDIPDRGRNSIEKKIGADLIMSVSVTGAVEFDKLILIQAKFERKINKSDMLSACNRMEGAIGEKGGYIWLYGENGVRVLSPYQVANMKGNSIKGLKPRSASGFTKRIFDCYAGVRDNRIKGNKNRRSALSKVLEELNAPHLIDISLYDLE
ncbi:hypothetical protein ACRC7T_06050 [Segnochrobactraceae bacterium EtOH-i3]